MYLTVGEISRVLGISTEAIRYYVKEGIITPRQNKENNYWEYSSEDFMKLTDILFYRSMGLTIEDIKYITSGQTLEKLGDVIEGRKVKLIREIKESVDALERLTIWKEDFDAELELIGNFKVGKMPATFRKTGYFDEENHMAHYLEENFDFDKEDWVNVSISFSYDLNDEHPQMQKYLAVDSTQKLKPSNFRGDSIEEREENCLITEVYFSDDVYDMIRPMMDYAAQQGIELDGRFYGWENTNFFTNGKRSGLYRVYAPIKTSKK